jgi:DNA-binding ferritin-like protein
MTTDAHPADTRADIPAVLGTLLADKFALYLKTKSFHSLIGRLRRNEDNPVASRDMLAELLRDTRLLVEEMRQAHALCDERNDVATASLLENWIDEAEGRAWFLCEAGRSCQSRPAP